MRRQEWRFSRNFRSMKPHFSKILVYITLVLLASFLVFWLYGEYQREREALRNEAYLDIAERLIGYGGGDFYQILADLEEPSADSLQFSLQVLDGFDIQRECDTAFRKIQYAPDHLLLTDSAAVEKVQVHQSHTQQGQGPGISVSVLMRSEDSLPLENGSHQRVLKKEVSMEFMESLQGNLVEDKAEIHRKALLNIVPEAAFASFLFGMLWLGIFSLQKSHANQQDLLESKNNLISNLTHELKTPITTIGIALEAIEDFNVKSDQAKTAQYIQSSRSELHRLSTAIDQVLLLSKMDALSQTYDFRQHDVMQLSRQVIQNLQPQIDKREATATINTPIVAALPEIIGTVDQTHFKHMLYNLLDNSLKYGASQIDITIGQSTGQINIKVKDNGIGIDPRHHTKLFDRFYRVPSGDRHNVKGYGLGLSYVKEIVDAHQGTIRIDSRKGQGTTFSIHLPNKQS